MARIFISHSTADKFKAIALKQWIVDGGWDDNPFIDSESIAAGERWVRALHEEVDHCEAVLFLLSRNWLKSDWCQKEFDLAQKLDKRLFSIVISDERTIYVTNFSVQPGNMGTVVRITP